MYTKTVRRTKEVGPNPDERICRRCGNVFKLQDYNEKSTNQCKFHPRVPGVKRGNKNDQIQSFK